MRLIDKDAIPWDVEGVGEIPVITKEEIDEMPTVDAVPVRHGKWLDSETFKRPWFRHHVFECSVCRNTLDMDGVNAGRGDANYCPNCGARMDGTERKDEYVTLHNEDIHFIDKDAERAFYESLAERKEE